jgi:type IV secretory pathway VirB3-like protein
MKYPKFLVIRPKLILGLTQNHFLIISLVSVLMIKAINNALLVLFFDIFLWYWFKNLSEKVPQGFMFYLLRNANEWNNSYARKNNQSK